MWIEWIDNRHSLFILILISQRSLFAKLYIIDVFKRFCRKNSSCEIVSIAAKHENEEGRKLCISSVLSNLNFFSLALNFGDFVKISIDSVDSWLLLLLWISELCALLPQLLSFAHFSLKVTLSVSLA